MNKIIRKIFSTRFLDVIPFTIFSIYLFTRYWVQSETLFLSLFILISGLALWYSGLFYLGKNFHGFSEPKTLITSGIYSKISHPIYLGAILSFIGLSIFSKHTFIILVTLILIPLQLIRASVEQKKLEQKYGEKYIKYKKGTWL